MIRRTLPFGAGTLEAELPGPRGFVPGSHATRCPVGWVLMVLLIVSSAPRPANRAWAVDPAVPPPRVEFKLTVTSPLELTNVPLDPEIDFAALIDRVGLEGVLDPNSIEVVNPADDTRVPHALGGEFAGADHRRVAWLAVDPAQREFAIRFRVVARRPPRAPADDVPAIGNGDLLRYNAGVPRNVTLFYAARLVDLTGDGRADLAGCWNYAYRPGEPWNGVICYPRLGRDDRLRLGDLVRLRYQSPESPGRLQHFSHTYQSADFADFNRDGRLDMVVTRRGDDTAQFFLATDRRDAGGFPIFEPSETVPTTGWEACRAVDLDGDRALDLIVEGNYVRNENTQGWPFRGGPPVKLNVGRGSCFYDVDRDGSLDAVCLRGKQTPPDETRIVWQRNEGGQPPRFGTEQLLEDIELAGCTFVSPAVDGERNGLLVQHDYFQSLSFFEQRNRPGEPPRFENAGSAESTGAVLSLGDQAWPSLRDWDDDGDLDLLVGGGYGRPRIVLNEGTPSRPVFGEAKRIHAAGKPIRILRDDVLGEPHNWHNMGYPFPDFVDWNDDGLPDLMLPNETNRIFWYQNVGTAGAPRFAERRQIVCDGFPDSPKLRRLSAERAADPQSPGGVYPAEPEQPFFWRTGVAFADWNGDSLMDFVTHDGAARKATLFVQYRTDQGNLRLRRAGHLELTDGRPIDDTLVERKAHWTESFRAVDWDADGLLDLLYSVAGAHSGTRDGGSIYLLRNAGTGALPRFEPPQAMRCFGEPIRITAHGPHPWPGDLDGDGKPDLLCCVEWSVYPFYRHAALTMPRRPDVKLHAPRIVEP